MNYLFTNFSGCTFEIWEWISNFIPHFTEHVINLFLLGLKLNHVSEKGPGYKYIHNMANRQRHIDDIFMYGTFETDMSC